MNRATRGKVADLAYEPADDGHRGVLAKRDEVHLVVEIHEPSSPIQSDYPVSVAPLARSLVQGGVDRTRDKRRRKGEEAFQKVPARSEIRREEERQGRLWPYHQIWRFMRLLERGMRKVYVGVDDREFLDSSNLESWGMLPCTSSARSAVLGAASLAKESFLTIPKPKASARQAMPIQTAFNTRAGLFLAWKARHAVAPSSANKKLPSNGPPSSLACASVEAGSRAWPNRSQGKPPRNLDRMSSSTTHTLASQKAEGVFLNRRAYR